MNEDPMSEDPMSEDRIIMKLKGAPADKLPFEIKEIVETLRQQQPNFTEDRLRSIAWYMRSKKIAKDK